MKEAQEALNIYLFELSVDCDLGNIEDYSADDFRISEVK
jgi:hypothetical protein